MTEDFLKKFMNMKTVFYILLTCLVIFMWRNPEVALMLFVAVVFASSLNPLVDKLERKINRPVATSIVLFSSIGLLLAVLLPIFWLCASQIKDFAMRLPSYVASIDSLTLKYPILQNFGLRNMNYDGIFESVVQYSSDIFGSIAGLFGSLGTLSVYVLLTLVFTFFFLADKEYIKSATLKLFPEDLRPKTEGLIGKIGQRIGSYVLAQICAIVSVGIVMGLCLWIFRVDYAFLLGLITAILDIIPVIGPAIALVICLFAIWETGLKSIIAVCVAFVLAQFIENNFVRPYAFGKLLKLHPMMVFIFLFIGTKYFGIVGTLFAPAIAATFCVLVEELYINNLNKAKNGN